MKDIFLKEVKATPPVMKALEKRGLIRLFRPTKAAKNTREGHVRVDKIYATSPKYGTHKLICVGFNLSKITLNYHPDAEDFIILKNPEDRVKPLYIIMGLLNYAVLEKKAAKGTLSSHDFIALKMVYNDPETAFFTMLKDTPHCEYTEPGKSRAPYFFVTEPNNFKMKYVDLADYRVHLK